LADFKKRIAGKTRMTIDMAREGVILDTAS
jgi:hypothetical protein